MRLYLAVERRRRGTGTYQVKCAGLSGLITLYVPNPALTRGAIVPPGGAGRLPVRDRSPSIALGRSSQHDRASP